MFNGTGIWVGMVYLVTGSIGLASGSVTAGSKKNTLYVKKHNNKYIYYNYLKLVLLKHLIKRLIWTLVMSAICVPLSWLLMTAPFSIFSIVIDILRKIGRRIQNYDNFVYLLQCKYLCNRSERVAVHENCFGSLQHWSLYK